jgi:hypothetical protein
MKNGFQQLSARKVTLPILNKPAPLLIVLLLILVVVCCCCPLGYGMIDSSLRSAGILPTNTPKPSSTATPTHTLTLVPSPTETTGPTQTPIPSDTPQPTNTPEPTNTPKPTETPEPTETPIEGPYVVIQSVDKVAEYVDIQNIGNQPQDLTGWKLVSEKGNQICWLYGIIEQNQTIRVWTNNPNGDGINCGYGQNIWNNSERDPAVLYNALGIEVDRY